MRPPRAFAPVWPAVICVAWAWYASGCSLLQIATDAKQAAKDALAKGGGEYAILTVTAWRCTAAAVVMVILAAGITAGTQGLKLPLVGRATSALRVMAAACVACAVGAWVLKLCLEQLHFYLPWAIGLTALCGLATLGLYVYGHRKVFRKRLGV